MKKLLLLFLFTAISLAGTAQGIHFQFDSISSPNYICQATAFTVEVFGTRSSRMVHNGSQNEFLRNDTVYVQFHFVPGVGQAIPAPLHRSILVPAPPIGRYIVYVQGFYNGVLHKTTETTLSVCSGISGIKENPTETPGLMLFPNPARDKIEIGGLPSHPDLLQATVLDITGKKLTTKLFQPGETKIMDVAGLPAGVYLLKLQTAIGTEAKKFVKE